MIGGTVAEEGKGAALIERRATAGSLSQQAMGESSELAEGGVPVASPPRVAVFFVGNKLMLDDGAAAILYEMIAERFDAAPSVRLYDVGCMSLDMLSYVDACDVLITIDAVDSADGVPGTIFRYTPDDLARTQKALSSLHDLRLADLFDTAALLGYRAQGGMFRRAGGKPISLQHGYRFDPGGASGASPSVRGAFGRAGEIGRSFYRTCNGEARCRPVARRILGGRIASSVCFDARRSPFRYAL